MPMNGRQIHSNIVLEWTEQLKWPTLLRLVGSLRKPLWQRQRESRWTKHLMSRSTGSRGRSVENTECGKLGVCVFAKIRTVLTKLRIPNFVSLNCIENQFSMLRKFVSRSKTKLTFREENHLRVGPRRRASPCKTRVAPSTRLLLLRVWKYGRGLVILPVMWHILTMFFCSFRFFKPHTGQQKPQLKFRRTQMS